MADKGKNIKNLKPFQKGQSGNPNGRPKKLPELDKLLVDVLGAEDDEHSEARAILVQLVKDAKNGNTRAAEILLDRAYGKQRQQTEVKADITSNGETIGNKEIVIRYEQCDIPLANSEDAVDTN